MDPARLGGCPCRETWTKLSPFGAHVGCQRSAQGCHNTGGFKGKCMWNYRFLVCNLFHDIYSGYIILNTCIYRCFSKQGAPLCLFVSGYPFWVGFEVCFGGYVSRPSNMQVIILQDLLEKKHASIDLCIYIYTRYVCFAIFILLIVGFLQMICCLWSPTHHSTFFTLADWS